MKIVLLGILTLGLVLYINVVAPAQTDFLWLEDVTSADNESQYSADLILVNANPLGGFQFVLDFDTSLVTIDSVIALKRLTGINIFYNDSLPNQVSVVVIGLAGEQVSSGFDAVIRFALSIAEDAQPGVSQLNLHDVIFTDIEGNIVSSSSVNGNLLIQGANILRMGNGFGLNSVNLYNSIPVGGVQFTLAYDPDVFSIDTVFLTQRSEHMTLNYNEQNSGSLIILLYSDDNDTIPAGLGGILKIMFADVKDSTSTLNPLNLSDVILTGQEGEIINSQVINGNYIILSEGLFTPMLSIALLNNPIINSYYDLYIFKNNLLFDVSEVLLNEDTLKLIPVITLGENVFHSSVQITKVGQNTITATVQDLSGNDNFFEFHFTLGKLVLGKDNLITHPSIGIEIYVPGSSLISDGEILITPIDLGNNREMLAKLYPKLHNPVPTDFYKAFIIATTVTLNGEFKISYKLTDARSVLSFYVLNPSGWEPLETFTDEQKKEIWTYPKEPGIFGLSKGGIINLLPNEFFLSAAYPNPFNMNTTVRYVVPSEGLFDHKFSLKVSLNIYNIRGQLVASLVDFEQPPGKHEASWDGRNISGQDVATGIYIMRLSVGGNVTARKLTVLK